jgi:hypothetical protein
MLGTGFLIDKEELAVSCCKSQRMCLAHSHDRCFQVNLIARQIYKYKICERTFESVRWGLESEHLSDAN